MHFYHEYSSRFSGYGSYTWLYLCEKDSESYILKYEYSDEYGCAVWGCLPIAKERIPEVEQTSGEALMSIYRAEWSEDKVIYHIHPTDLAQVKPLIVPDFIRSGKLTDVDFYGK